MSTAFRDRTQSRLSLRPAGLALAAGVSLHTVEGALFPRAGPGPILLTVPVVATLTYLHGREATYGRLLGLAGWGVLASGLGVLAVYLLTVTNYLPRPLTGPETAAYDLGMFAWFVLVPAALYAVAARVEDRTAVAVLAVVPVAQAAFALLLPALVALGPYG